MARPVRNGLLYFPIDVDFFNDKKIKALKARYGGDGIAFYLYLLTEIYRNGYYITWDMDSEDSAIADLNISEGFIKQVLTFLVGRSLLTSITTNSDTIITSPVIQKTYQEAIKGLRRDIEVDPDIWLLNENDTAPFIKVTQKQGLYSKNHSKYGNNGNKNGINDTNKIKENKKKINKNKTKEGVPPVRYSENDKLDKAIHDYINHRKKVKAPMTDYAIELMLKKLNTLADNDDDRIKILEQSVFNGWKGIFPLDSMNNKRNADSGAKPTRFTNYEEHDWNYEELSRIKQAELIRKLEESNV